MLFQSVARDTGSVPIRSVREKSQRTVFHTGEKKEGKMRATTRWLSRAMTVAIAGGFLLGAAPQGSAAQVRRRVIIVEPFSPFYPWGYPYPYPGYYRPSNYGEVKIDTHRKDLAVYINGGFAARSE